MAKGKVRRKKLHELAPNITPLVPERYLGRSTTSRGDAASELKRSLRDEAQCLTGMGDSRGVELLNIVNRLPLASFERIVR